MNKYLSSCFLICAAPSAFANLGSGFYASVGVGGGIEDTQQLDFFDVDYATIYSNADPNLHLIPGEVNYAFQQTAEYSNSTQSVFAGRAAVGYLWDIFEGEPTEIGESIYTFNATLGLEFGYRLFDNATSSLTNQITDSVNPGCNEAGHACTVDETVTTKNELQAFDLLAVARLPFTEDSKLALLLKAGVAYNISKVSNSMDVEIVEGGKDGAAPGYENTYDLGSTKHDEFLGSVGAGLEYMIYTHFGLSAEYNAIVGSSHNADSQLIIGNIVIRI